jgi:hypothetical protein
MSRKRIVLCGLAAAAGLAVLVQAVVSATDAKDTAVRDKYILKEEPKESVGVLQAREKAKDKDDVVVIGRIGGRINPWVKGAAAFSIVDTSLKACNERPGDTCPTPWDFCCEVDLGKSTVLVTLLDEKTGQTLKQDAREALKLKELQTVVVQGKARRDSKGNISIAASHLFVRPEKEAAK